MISSGQDLTETQHSFLLLKYGAIWGENLHDGEYWKLFTSQFTHVNFLHMLLNVSFIFVLGQAIEKEFGALHFVLVYLLSGFAGQFASVLFTPDIVSSGASQAICGLTGFALIYSRRFYATHRVAIVAVAIFIFIQIGLDLYFAGYLKAGHSVGFVSGIVLGIGRRSFLQG